MSQHLGSRVVGTTVYRGFTTHAGAGGNVAPSTAFEAADIRIYKNGSATQRSSSAGITVTSPFDSITGGHMLAIDLSDNTDAGFYNDGDYMEAWLVPNDETIDGEAVSQILCSFDIVAAAPTVQDVIDGVLDALLSAHTTAGTVGKALGDILLAAVTTIPGLLPSSLTGDGRMRSDVEAINESPTAAVQLQKYADLEEFFPVDAHMQKVAVAGGFRTTKKPDGSTDTPYSPTPVTSDPAAEPITEVG